MTEKKIEKVNPWMFDRKIRHSNMLTEKKHESKSISRFKKTQNLL